MDNIYIVYLDDILIFSERREEYEGYIRLIMQALIRVRLYRNKEKSKFEKIKVSFLGYIILGEVIIIKLKRVKVIIR